MRKVVFNVDRCKGCELCTSVCPKGVLAMSEELNSQGYHPAMLTDEERCTSCGICAMICPDMVISVYRKEIKSNAS